MDIFNIFDERYIVATYKRKISNKSFYSKNFPNFKIFDAVEPQNIREISSHLSLKSSYNIMENKRDAAWEIDELGSVGCYLSHVALWRLSVEEDKNILILEDDVAPTTLSNDRSIRQNSIDLMKKIS